MFKLIGTYVSAPPEVLIDPYVPVTIQWPHYAAYPGRPENHMLAGEGGVAEMKLTPGSGEVLEFVVVDLNRITSSSRNYVHPGSISGVPAVSVDVKTTDEFVKIIRYPNGMEICFSSEAAVSRVGSERAVFGFSESGSLVCLGFPLEEI